jgi:hypothetical protein
MRDVRDPQELYEEIKKVKIANPGLKLSECADIVENLRKVNMLQLSFNLNGRDSSN